jgi:hypothetical protein
LEVTGLKRLLPTNRKIFCIGFNKTGTDSLHHFFQLCSFRSKHGHDWSRISRTRFGKPYIQLAADCYSDGEQSEFRNLQGWFPNSVFILNDRSERAWLRSRVKHVLRAGDIDPATAVKMPEYQGMSEDYFTSPEEAVDRWILERRFYYTKVYAWFDGASNFLELRVTEDPQWKTALADFLREHDFSIPSSVESREIHANRRAEAVVPAAAALAEGYEVVDRCLERRQDFLLGRSPAQAIAS